MYCKKFSKMNYSIDFNQTLGQRKTVDFCFVAEAGDDDAATAARARQMAEQVWPLTQLFLFPFFVKYH